MVHIALQEKRVATTKKRSHLRFLKKFSTKHNFNYLDVKLKVFKKDDNKEFRLVPNFTMGQADFTQFMRLRNQLVNAAENFAREENLSPVLIPTMSKDMDEQLELAHKVVDAVDRANIQICVTLLRYNMDKPKNLCAQVQIFAKRNEEEFINKLFMWIKNLKNLSVYLM